jgi:hypothetical protein
MDKLYYERADYSVVVKNRAKFEYRRGYTFATYAAARSPTRRAPSASPSI